MELSEICNQSRIDGGNDRSSLMIACVASVTSLDSHEEETKEVIWMLARMTRYNEIQRL